jgi:hypothetical protein
MSSIGMQEEVCSLDEFTLVRTDGAGFGEIFDCDGDHILNVPLAEMEAVEKAFPTVIAMFRRAHTIGVKSGRWQAQREMQKALGL